MEGEEPALRLRTAVERLESARKELIAASPQSLEGCAGLIERACRELTGISPRSDEIGSRSGTRAAALELRIQIRHTRRLLDQAWRFHERWGQMLGARTGGYLPGGQAAPMPNRGRLWLKG